MALGDLDGDGRVDLVFAASGSGSQVWRNLGDWKFENVTARLGAHGSELLSGDLTGVAIADLTGDGRPEIVFNSHSSGIQILHNRGGMTFESLPFLQVPERGGHSVALADVDGDGWVDLYVCNYRQRALMDMPNARATFQGTGPNRRLATLDGRPATDPDLTNRFVVTAAGGLEELGEPDVLYRNLGGTNFAPVGWNSGSFLDPDGSSLKEPLRDWGLAAQFFDVNGDGRPDLYVCNDFQTPDRFWLNESQPGQIRLRLVSRSTLRQTSLFSMGVDFADLNRDGLPDFVVLDMLSPDPVRRLTMLDGTPSVAVDPLDPLARPQIDANTLFLQRPGGSFAQVAAFAGVTATDWSWTPAFLDVDLDGWPDLLVTSGQERGSRDLDVAEAIKAFRRGGIRTDAQILRERQKFPQQHASLRAFRNRGLREPDGIPSFEDWSAAWGFDFSGVSHGMALGDLDGDGDLDVVINHLNAPAGVYRNLAAAPRVYVQLKGRAPNTDALGARIRFWWEPKAETHQASFARWEQSAQVFGGGRYLSSDAFGRAFACPGEGTGVLEIRWPSGRITVQSGIEAGRRLEIGEPPRDGSVEARASRSHSNALAFDAVDLGIRSGAADLSEFSSQPLLPRRQAGRYPALAAIAGRDEGVAIWVGGSPGQPLRELDLTGGKPGKTRSFGEPGAMSSLLRWGGAFLVGGVGGVVQIEPVSSEIRRIPTTVKSPSCLALSSNVPVIGALLFVGGSADPGRFPASVSSEVLRYDGAEFRSVLMTNQGLVTSAQWADLDGDGMPELMVTRDWGSPGLFRLNGAQFEWWNLPVHFEGRDPVPLSAMNGWWQSGTVADLDGDGRLDWVLGNWGFNSGYALLAGPPKTPEGLVRPLVLYHGDALEAGPGGCIEGYTGEDGRVRPVHGLADLGSRIPWVTARFPKHRQFAEATLDGILGDRAVTLGRVECQWMGSLVLFHRGDHFEARVLPDEVQLGPVFAWTSGDFDGDGTTDLFGAQGFFGHNWGTPRDDAGEGVFVLNRGKGRWEAVSLSATGVRVLGEQRSALAVDVNRDGAPDLVIGEMGGPVTLLLNRRH